jgi:hypothetical protein
MSLCSTCGHLILTDEALERRSKRLGSSGRQSPLCLCLHPKPRRASSRRESTQNITYVSPAPSIADQLAVLAKLRKEGSLTEQEFQTLKTRLISGDKL